MRLLGDRPIRAALATGMIWGIWHYPFILVGGEATGDRFWTLILLPVATTISSVFLGWLRLLTGEVWVSSVAHAANNVTEDSWHRLAFTGQTTGVLPISSAVPVLIAEALVLLGVVAFDRRRQSAGNSSPVTIVDARIWRRL